MDSEPDGTTGGLVALDKANAGSLAVPALRYSLESASYVVEELDEESGELREVAASCGVAVWRGEVAGDGREVARAALAPRLEREDSPEAWLREYLSAAGEALRPELMAAAPHSVDAVKRAARKLRVPSRDASEYDPRSCRPIRRAYWSLAKNGAHAADRTVRTFPGEGSHPPTTPLPWSAPKSAKGAKGGVPPERSVGEPRVHRSEQDGQPHQRAARPNRTEVPSPDAVPQPCSICHEPLDPRLAALDYRAHLRCQYGITS